VRWANEKSGHVLLEKMEKEKSTRTKAVVSVVGRVLEDRLNCGPNGNFINKVYGSLRKAKYQLRLAKPTETPFGSDFDTVQDNVRILQAQRAATETHKNFIDDDELRFSENVFEQRVSSLTFPQIRFAETDAQPRPRRSNKEPPSIALQSIGRCHLTCAQVSTKSNMSVVHCHCVCT
jgi:hypothetical protein